MQASAVARRLISCLSVLLLLFTLANPARARTPHRPRKFPPPPPIPYSEEEINTITNIVNGEVGEITGRVSITYADGSVQTGNGSILRMIHTRVVHNQVQSSLFPDTVRGCAVQYWSRAYAGTGWRSSKQWQSCREDVVFALRGLVDVPDTVFAATCDPYFARRYPSYRLWAKVRWNTGWVSGTFYYYAYES